MSTSDTRSSGSLVRHPARGLRGRAAAWCLGLSLLCCGPCLAQETRQAHQDGLLQLNDALHRFLERQQAAGRLDEAFLLHQPLSAYEARRYLDTLAAHADVLGAADRYRLARFRGELPAPGAARVNDRAGFVYGNGHNLFALEGDGYGIQVDPLLYVSYGGARHRRPGATTASWSWARGARIAGHVTRHVFFETRLTENLERLAGATFTPDSLLPLSARAPRLGTVGLHDGAVGYYTGAGVVGLRTRFFEVRFGRDHHRWGPGTGSLVLSNYAPVLDHLQIRTTVGPFQYVNLFAGLAAPRLRPRSPINDFAIPRKYAAMHQLAVDLPGRLQLALFESVVFGTDSLGARRGFDLSYLNPVLFYRAVERDRGSPDNVLLGGSVAWNALPGVRPYTQFMLDELVVGQIGKGWWGNKWGWLLGVHLADLPVRGLSVRLEYARLRPYLYSHRAALTDYVHYDDVLGHPAGPNSEDVALFVTYEPTPRLSGMLNVAFTRHGRNTAGANYGGDPLESYETRVRDDGVRLLQGVRQRSLLVEGSAGYELLPGLHLEALLRAASLDDDETGRDGYVSLAFLLRWNLPYQSVRY